MSSKIESSRLTELIQLAETDLVELKREWWDLDSKLGKGELAKHVLAMANAVTPSESAFIIFGVEDKKVGGAVLGVAEAPSQETVAQVLSTYTNPVPRIKVEEVLFTGKKVSVLEIIWSEFHPYYATRDVDNVLSTDAVYTRRAGTVGRLKPVEIERLIRAKEARLGKMNEQCPVNVGFVELPGGLGKSDRISVRVVNIIEEPVTNISACIDFILVHYSRAIWRTPFISNLTLAAGEAREFDVRISDASFYDELQGKPLRYQSFVWASWFDIRLHLMYRGRDGILCEIVREASLG